MSRLPQQHHTGTVLFVELVAVFVCHMRFTRDFPLMYTDQETFL